MTDRIYKINELIKEEVGRILQKEVSLENGVLTVKAVETTNDLRQSTVWLAYFGDNEEQASSAVEEKAKEVQQTINHRLKIKHVPKLSFRFDKSGDYADHLNQIFRRLHEK